jgi:hypothetical protein
MIEGEPGRRTASGFAIALVGVVVAIAASTSPAGSHEWYTGLRSPSGAPCCNERDCRPVAYRINRVTGREEIQANGAWYPVERDKVLPFSSPDGGYHACWGNAAGRPNFRCIMLPGLASLPRSKALAWTTLTILFRSRGSCSPLVAQTHARRIRGATSSCCTGRARRDNGRQAPETTARYQSP